MAWVQLLPIGGVSVEKENIFAWIQAGTATLGIGSKLISSKAITTGDYDAITANVKQILV